MAKTSVDAKRHVRQLLSLFRNTSELGTAVVEAFIRSHQQRKYLKQSLKRLITRGFILEESHKFVLTKHGRKAQLRSKNKRVSKTTWDGKWRLISFDVPGNYSKERNQIRSLLREFDFYKLQKSVWICPNQVAKHCWELMVEHDLARYCKAMLVEIIEGDTEVKKHFKLDS